MWPDDNEKVDVFFQVGRGQSIMKHKESKLGKFTSRGQGIQAMVTVDQAGEL